MQDDSDWLKGLLSLAFIFAIAFVSYHIGKQSTIHKVLTILDQEQSVAIESVVLEDIREDILNLK
jgi:hypothetical protein